MEKEIIQTEKTVEHVAAFLLTHEFYFLLATLAGCLVIFFLTRSYVNPTLVKLVTRKNKDWRPVLKKMNTFRQVAFLTPALFFMTMSQYSTKIWGYTDRVLDAYVALNITLLLASFVRTANEVYELYPISKEKPIKSYTQLLTLIIYILGSVIVICEVTQTDPTVFLGGAVAVLAAILLVFRDTLLSFIASMQIATNNLIQRGDWVEVPAFGADGTVIDIALHVVRIQNFDNTIVTIPTYKLMETGFKNWRGMFESGGRQIKKSILIDQNSLRFMKKEDIKRIFEHPMIKTYLPSVEELERQHEEVSLESLTNLGILRTYLVSYLKKHPHINKKMTILVRVLEPTPNGVPLQIYAYTDDTRWFHHEHIKGDILEHVIALLKVFDLRVYQNMMDTDIEALDRIGQKVLGK